MNNERLKEMNNILIQLKEYAKVNNITDDFHKIIYRYLHDYNVGNEKNLNVKNKFPFWINRYSTKRTNCVNTPKYPYWCQFINENYPNQTLMESDPVKIYIPLKSSYIYNGVNKIFDFCEQNSIIHNSKVAATIRNDNVVLRVMDVNDAIKIINYVNNDPYLQEGHLKPNPFCFQVDFTGLAVDNYNSYNENVAKFLEKYLKYSKNTNNLDNVSVTNFYNFVKNNKLSYQSSKDKIYQEEIRRLILISLTTDDINLFIDHYYSVSGNNKQAKRYKRF